MVWLSVYVTCSTLTYSIWPDSTFEEFQGNDEGEQNSLTETDIFQDITLEGIPSIYTCHFDAHAWRDLDIDLPEIDQDPRDDEIDFLGVVMLVDSEGNSDNWRPRFHYVNVI